MDKIFSILYNVNIPSEPVRVKNELIVLHVTASWQDKIIMFMKKNKRKTLYKVM